ncbi:exopolysaccharide biosynthesis protein [Ehrlichia canis]|uniref:Exopolysaccharide synthesis, ExoD n=1 Tax=Ehrlichia canis (strain Jake) TaxID=269484 RepID=A0ACA6AVV8_EHRCJ|nr:exopolysaccharide biosynthesis protein [Ehrlichia canis]AAZ68351.1 Exopolysaccharide synthesis, ExoD [Ehrlichia canis str. Jake]AUO54890.1 exopolysaccharide biosynthesis protein exod [Ehrlichia canis]UKC53556.1 exopolysaccharide biosynthesis protein [Ehrlichia canis]UKC54494.1 exopolysaccharide biosynthesis protein [Ehrlichia canis]UKC55430.1 exopolysaccharide biosynthesis protein [Ehrlichia canis]
MSQEKNKAVSDLLEEVTNNTDVDRITLFELKSALHARGFGILMLLFSLPLSIPLPVPPGYTTIFSIPLLMFAFQMLLGFQVPWMPSWLEKKSFKRTTLALIIEKTAPILRKAEKLTKPRLLFIFNSVGEKVIAFISLLCAVSIAIPLPLTNFIPAGGVSIMSLGLLNKDGMMVILGVLLSLFGIVVTTMVIILGPKLVVSMFSFLSKFT